MVLAGTTLSFGADKIAQLDIVVRDFSVTHPDFENFSEEYAAGHGAEIQGYGKAGYDATWFADDALHRSCGNQSSRQGAMIGTNGLPMTANEDPGTSLPAYLRQTSPGPVLKYGECAGSKHRGYHNATSDVSGESCAEGAWGNEVWYTPGMVMNHLAFDPPKEGEYDMYDGVHIQKGFDRCDNAHFDQWYSDVPNVCPRCREPITTRWIITIITVAILLWIPQMALDIQEITWARLLASRKFRRQAIRVVSSLVLNHCPFSALRITISMQIPR